MYIKNLYVNNFRNISNLNINFSNKINYFYGDNGQGKTNLVEAIYFISLLKSFRTKNNIDLINFNSDIMKISSIISDIIENKIDIFFNKKKAKEIKINNKLPEKNQLYSLITCFIFYSDEINNLKSYPSYRRNFIDKSIFYNDNNYLEKIKNYNRCLNQRNIELKITKNDDIWFEQLIEYGSLIINERINYIDKINNNIKNYKNENYNIKYLYNKKSKIKDLLFDKYKNVKNNELKLGYTLFGPHTDDFIFTINDLDFRKFSSEGQKSSFLLNLKYSQFLDYIDIYKKSPILIFDDIGNELDENRKNYIFEKFFDKDSQIFITNTQLKEFMKDLTIFKVTNGNFIQTN